MNAAIAPTGMRLSELLDGILNIAATDDCHIDDITLDSREVVAGSCFFALQGTRLDALQFVADAVAGGARAVVADAAVVGPEIDVPLIRVPALKPKLGTLAARFFRYPSNAVRVFAVTGTNGKTTVAYLLAKALRVLEGACGYLGTLGVGEPGMLSPQINTTPDVIRINRTLADLRERAVRACTLEASSHALDQGRLDGLAFAAAAFTNLSRDHLDYHGTLERYVAAKQRLFAHPGVTTAIINIDDAYGAAIAGQLGAGIDAWTCSSRLAPGAARISATAVVNDSNGLSFTLHAAGAQARVSSALVGRFNVDNLLVIAACLLSAGHSFADVCTTLAGLDAVPGRMEHCGRSAAGAAVYVDYAHSPDSLSAALTALRELAPQTLTVVFGCGGNRDVGKRALMGAAAVQLADRVVVTSDNPRDEDEVAIANAIVAGMTDTSRTDIILDRASAIRAAIENAGEGDIVLIAGKGHETTQERRGRQTAFDDRAEIHALLAEVKA